MPSRNSKPVRKGGQSPHFLSVSGLQMTTDRWARPGPQMPQVIWQGQRGSRWNRNTTLSPSTASKNHPEEKRDTPQNNERRCSWSCQHPVAKEPTSRKLQGAPAAASEESICAGGVSKNGTMLSPKLLLCPPLCHKRHLTPHRREGVCSALLWRARMKPRRQSSEAPSPSWSVRWPSHLPPFG